MLLPSSIQRAEDFVGIAMPTVGLVCANTLLEDAMAARPANASANDVVFRLSILHSLWVFRISRCGRLIRDRRSSSQIAVQELRLTTSYEFVSLTSGSGRPRAATSIRKVRPWSGSAARAASSIPCQADVTNRRDRSGPTKAGQLDWRAGTRTRRRCPPRGR